MILSRVFSDGELGVVDCYGLGMLGMIVKQVILLHCGIVSVSSGVVCYIKGRQYVVVHCDIVSVSSGVVCYIKGRQYVVVHCNIVSHLLGYGVLHQG